MKTKKDPNGNGLEKNNVLFEKSYRQLSVYDSEKSNGVYVLQ
jgi:hypothetical protein